MQNSKTLLAFMFVFLFAISFASASTVIAGKIYTANFEDTVSNATVTVTCDALSSTVQSNSDGSYATSFNTTLCNDADTASVHAFKAGVGENTINGTIHDFSAIMPDLNIGVVNVPLVPEFGFIIGSLTLVSAVVVFFVIRRK